MQYKYKQVIVVRSDLKISKGKLAAQVAHAAVTSFYKSLQTNKDVVIAWLNNNQPKIVLKVNSESELLRLHNSAVESGLVSVIIRDAGLTELPPGTITCIGIGPDRVEYIDEITGHLPLL